MHSKSQVLLTTTFILLSEKTKVWKRLRYETAIFDTKNREEFHEFGSAPPPPILWDATGDMC